MMRARHAVRTAVAAAALVASLAACGNNSSVAAKRPHQGSATASPVGSVLQVRITTGNDLRFHPSTIVVPARRKVRIVLANTASPGDGPPHNLVVDGDSGGVPYANAGQTQSWQFTTPAAGRYRFVCQLHVDQGQTGTMIVKG